VTHTTKPILQVSTVAWFYFLLYTDSYRLLLKYTCIMCIFKWLKYIRELYVGCIA